MSDEREQRRQELRDRAIAEANRLGRTLTCRHPDVAAHSTCVAMKYGPLGCLCECHDPAPVLSGQPEADR